MTEVSSVKCRICGRKLHNPISVAMGIGPKCAGGRPGTGRRIRARPRTASHRLYAGNTHLTTQTMPLIGTTELVYRDQLLRLVTVPLTARTVLRGISKHETRNKKRIKPDAGRIAEGANDILRRYISHGQRGTVQVRARGPTFLA